MLMTAIGIARTPLSAAEHSRQLRRAMVASTVGTIIEAYDFLLYVLVAPLVFAKLYFPASAPLAGILQAFGIYAVGFIARPIGAALFGHYGDRIGRKVTLISTLLLTGLSTFAVGFVPGYASIGIWGAVILTVVRFIQGLGIGGEWGGATLMAMEWARPTPIAASSPLGRNGAVRLVCFLPMSRCWFSAQFRVTSFSTGDGGCRSGCRS
jgi:MFS family permease